MNKIKLIITNCKSEINSLLNRVRGKEITHIIVTTNGDKIKCSESVELFSDETVMIVAKCLNRMKQYIMTINNDNIDYILEKYDGDVWKQISNIANNNVNNDGEIIDDRLYG